MFHIFFVLLGWNSFQMVFVMYAITYVSIYSLIFWGSTMEAILVCVGPTLPTCHLTGLCLDFKYLWHYLTDKLTDAGKWANCVEFQGFFLVIEKFIITEVCHSNWMQSIIFIHNSCIFFWYSDEVVMKKDMSNWRLFGQPNFWNLSSNANAVMGIDVII